MIVMLFATVSCAKADYEAPTHKLKVAKPPEYTLGEQVKAADELEHLDKLYGCDGCSILQKMMIGYKKLRDKNRLARGEKLP